MHIIISSDGSISLGSAQKSKRELKGKSLTAILPDYTVLDIETTGLDPSFDEIIEVSAIRVRGNSVCDTFSSLVKPASPVDDFIVELTGITNEMLDTAPTISDVFPRFIQFVGDDVIVGHNVNFDINFLYDTSSILSLAPFKNDFIDTMRLSRKLFPEAKNHKLGTLAQLFNIPQPVSHRSAADCDTTNSIYRHISQYVSENEIDLSALFAKKRYTCKAADIQAEVDSFGEDSPFFGKVCVFTGVLEKMVRRDAMQIVVNMGGICGDSVTAKTNYLILGNNDYCSSIKDGKSSKQKKAEGLILKGKDLSIISEDVFYDMIGSI